MSGLISPSKSITGANDFTTGTPFQKGPFNFSIKGTFVATVHLQRSFDDGSNWEDIASFTKPEELQGEAARSMLNALRFLRNKWSIHGLASDHRCDGGCRPHHGK